MSRTTTSGFQEGFVEIVEEQIRALAQETKEHDLEIGRLEEMLSSKRQQRLEAANRLEQLRNLLSDNQPNGTRSSERVARRPFADADAVVSLIREHGAPMHYETIHQVLVRRGFEIGGKGEANTLLSRYFKDPRLTRVSRGTYDIATEVSIGDPWTPHIDRAVVPQSFSLDISSIPKASPLVEKIALVLRHAGEPLHYREITNRLLSSGAWQTNGQTPEATVNSRLVVEINENGSRSTFARTAPGVYGLREWDVVSD